MNRYLFYLKHFLNQKQDQAQNEVIEHLSAIVNGLRECMKYSDMCGNHGTCDVDIDGRTFCNCENGYYNFDGIDKNQCVGEIFVLLGFIMLRLWP